MAKTMVSKLLAGSNASSLRASKEADCELNSTNKVLCSSAPGDPLVNKEGVGLQINV